MQRLKTIPARRKSHSIHMSMAVKLYFALLLLCLARVAMAAGLLDIDPDNMSTHFNVMSFGAKGDGMTDDSQAFQMTWEAACSAHVAMPSVVVPMNREFLVNPLTFNGPCKSSVIRFNVAGTILAPETPATWDGKDSQLWLVFKQVNGLSVWGTGTINGRGTEWWKQSCKWSPKLTGCTTFTAPTAMRFDNCTGVKLEGLKFVDSPQIHVLVYETKWVQINNINIAAAADSPNTDGIHLHASQHVTIQYSTIGSGDDCVSIGDRSSDINITNINCGPGHGISVGSLGMGGANVAVENIHVSYVNFYGTSNGARIKTWQGGSGYARGISFQHLTFDKVVNPIIVDQYYCDVPGMCTDEPTNVAITDVTYYNATGTSSKPNAVTLNCAKSGGCTGLVFDTVSLTAAAGDDDTYAVCINAHGVVRGNVQPALSCLEP